MIKKILLVTTLSIAAIASANAANCHRIKEYNGQNNVWSAQWKCTVTSKAGLKKMFQFKATNSFYRNCKLINVNSASRRFVAMCRSNNWDGRRRLSGNYNPTQNNLVNFHPNRNGNYFTNKNMNGHFTNQYMANR